MENKKNVVLLTKNNNQHFMENKKNVLLLPKNHNLNQITMLHMIKQLNYHELACAESVIQFIN